MANTLVVHKNRTNIVTVSLGYDVSEEVITSQIRLEPEQESQLILEWDVQFTNNGTDGELTLTLTDEQTANIEVKRGWMDLKRDTGGSLLPVFDRPLEVEFRGTVTV